MIPSQSGAPAPDPEVLERPKRRRFTAKYKLSILARADRCARGEVGALLRSEGLYSSHLTAWRKERERGAQAALGRKRGPKSKVTSEQREIARLERENARLRRELEKKDLIIEVQKKVSEAIEKLSEEND